VDRTGPPPAAPLEPYRFPAFGRRTLATGLEVLAAPVPRAPLVDLSLVLPAGGRFDPPGAAGLATLVSALLDEGTEERSALEIAAAVERLGGRLETGADWNVATVSVRLLAEYLEEGLRLLAELLLRPTFPADEVERTRRHRLTDLLRRLDRPGVVASDHFSALVYGDTVYGRPLVGVPEDVRTVDRETILRFYRRHYGAGSAVLIGVGELDPERFTALAGEVLGGADHRVSRGGAPGEAVAAPEIEPPAAAGRRVRIVDRPAGAQSELRIGHAGVPRSHPDWTALAVIDILLGGKFTSRLNLNLRERHGFTYGVSSRFVPRLGPGPFVVNTAVANPVAGAAVREVLAELERLREEPVPEEELADTKSYILGVFPYTLQTVSGVLYHLENLTVYGLPDDHYAPERYLERLEAVTPEAILRVAREHIRPERAAVVAVGPAAELAPQLQGVGELEVMGL
jgi:zinc protease